MTINILYLITSRVVSGGEKSLLSLVGSLDASEYHCKIALPEPDLLKPLLPDTGVECFAVPELETLVRRRNPLFLARYLFIVLHGIFKLLRLIKRYRIDVVHANSISAAIYAALIGLLTRKKTVMHIRDIRTHPRTVKFVRFLAMHGIDRAVFVSNATLRHYFPDEHMCPRCTAIYNGIDADAFEKNAASGPEHFGVPEVVIPDHAVGIVGLLTPWKGQLDVIEAFSRVYQARPEVTLWIVGDGDDDGYKQVLRDAVTRLNLQSRIFFTGFSYDVASIMKKFRVLVNASRMPDPLPRVLLEAMALGVPIVAPSIGGVPEQITHGYNGLLYEPGDVDGLAQQIGRLLDDRPLTRQCVENGRQVVRTRFSLESHVNQMKQIYALLAPPG